MKKRLYLVTFCACEQGKFNPKTHYVKKWLVCDNEEECANEAQDLIAMWCMRHGWEYRYKIVKIEYKGKISVEDE